MQLKWLLPFILPVFGCILIASAAYLVAPPLGLAVAGLSCFGIDIHMDMEKRRNR
jgi:hypothetical protein